MKVAVCGGSGFVGRALCKALLARDYEVVVLSTKQGAVQGGMRSVKVDYHDKESLKQALDGCRALINLVGILHQNKQQTFQWVHDGLVANLLEAAAAVGVGVKDYMHMGALGADSRGPSDYLKSKAAGEMTATALTAQHNMRMLAFRPSIIFGEEDDFFNQFARILRFVPVLPLVCPNAKFQPVAVEDVAAAFVWGLESSVGQAVYELGGTEVITMREVIGRVCDCYGWRRLIIPLPDMVSKIQGKIMGLLPNAPFTFDNYLSMQKPNTTEQQPWAEMGITPQPIKITRLW